MDDCEDEGEIGSHTFAWHVNVELWRKNPEFFAEEIKKYGVGIKNNAPKNHT